MNAPVKCPNAMPEQPAQDCRTSLSRRRLLGGLGALSIALTAPIWRAATAFGKDSQTPAAKRFIGVFSANGTVASDFFPKTTEFKLGKILTPLKTYQDRLLVLKGVHMNSTVEDKLGVASSTKPGGPHMKGPGAMLTGGSLMTGSFTGSGGPAGYADRESVDQYLATRLNPTTRFRSLEFGVRIEGQEPLRVISYRGANQPNIAVDDPFAVYARLFADQALGAAELKQALAERRSVLDFLKSDINRLQTRITAADKARLDAHLTGVRSLEQQLASATNACTAPKMPAKFDTRAIGNFETVAKLQIDLMLLAHACDMTRISTFMFANADSWQYFPFAGVNEEHHELSHAGDDDTEALAKLISINAWHSSQVARMLDGLQATANTDGEGSLLDNTLLLWGNELGSGNTHTYKDIPWLLAGGAGYFKMGRSLQFKDQPHNNLLVSVCNAMGLEDVTTFGIPGVCTGPLQGLTA